MNLSERNSVNRNRNKLDIVRDMLAVASTGTKKTRIMYQANLNFVQVEKYLNTLLDGGLLMRDNGGTIYLTTEKGKEFLKSYADYLERCRRLVVEVDGTVKLRLVLEGMCFHIEKAPSKKQIWKNLLS